jgi:hypothetical protein
MVDLTGMLVLVVELVAGVLTRMEQAIAEQFFLLLEILELNITSKKFQSNYL